MREETWVYLSQESRGNEDSPCLFEWGAFRNVPCYSLRSVFCPPPPNLNEHPNLAVPIHIVLKQPLCGTRAGRDPENLSKLLMNLMSFPKAALSSVARSRGHPICWSCCFHAHQELWKTTSLVATSRSPPKGQHLPGIPKTQCLLLI